MQKLVNALLFQAIWFSAVLVGWQWAIWPLVALFLHGLIKERGQHAYGFLLLFAFAGIALDTLWFSLGWFRMPDPSVWHVAGMPLWLMCMWPAFALTLGSSLSWWRQWPLTFILACAVAGPLSYFAGMRLGALHITDQGFIALVCVWTLAGTVIVWQLPKRVSGQSSVLAREASGNEATAVVPVSAKPRIWGSK